MNKVTILLILILFAVNLYAASPIAIFDAKNENNTLNIIAAWDGKYIKTTFNNKPAVENQNFRTYLYFGVSPELRDQIGDNVWLLVEGGSAMFCGVQIRYSSISNPYTYAQEIRSMASNTPDKFLIKLPNAKFSGAQNDGADFRIETYKYNINKIELYNEKPDIDLPDNTQRLNIILNEINKMPDLSVSKTNPMEYVVCGDDQFGQESRLKRQKEPWFGTSFDEESIKLLKKLGVTSIQCYVTWESCEPQKDKWDFSGWDKEIHRLKESNMKFSPFLILGPSYSVPDWFRKTSDHIPGRCLEHGEVNMVDNVWNPNIIKYADNFMKKFSQQYDANILQTVLLGIQGDFGEAIHPIMGGLAGIEPGSYHGHEGFWCDNPIALKEYQGFLQKEYKNISSLNKAWNKSYANFNTIDFPARGEEIIILRKTIKDADGYTRREYLDFVTWYRWAMNNLADKWFTAAKKYFPNTPVYLCTGGGGDATHGSDMSLNSKTAGKHKGGIRITNEGSVYKWNNLSTRLLTSAARFYGARTGKEPFGDITPEGVVARMYGSITSGSTQHEDYYRNVADDKSKYDYHEKYVSHLQHYPNIVVPISLYYPNIAVTLDYAPYWPEYESIRNIINCDYIDENMLRDGALKNTRFMIMPSTIIEPKDARQIADWVSKGGTLIVMGDAPLQTVERTDKSEKILFPKSSVDSKMGKGIIYRQSDFQRIRQIINNFLDENNYPIYGGDGSVFGAQVDKNKLLFLNTENRDIIWTYKYKKQDYSVNVPAFGMAESVF